jgi:hypothetical protein
MASIYQWDGLAVVPTMPAFISRQGGMIMAIAFRASGPLNKIQKNLGFLGDLPGTFVGTGFNLIARPDKQNNNPFFLELNATQEILEFTNIGGDIPNRGSIESDLILHGVRYLQRVADCATHTAIHLEPGLWLHVPATAAPNPVTDETYVRQATIPHGDSILAQSTFLLDVNSGPQIAPVDSTPFTGDIPDLNSSPANPVTNADYLKPFRETPLPTECLPAGLDAVQTIKNPALVLQAAIAGQNITETIVIQISTASVQNGGIVNIPFVVQNANATRLDAIFWIEKVTNPAGGAEPFIQLQYVQRVILAFPPAIGAPIISWPHISVATLVKTL